MRYFSTQRPVAPGAFPKPVGNKVLAVDNFDTFDGRRLCPAIGLEAYGYVDHEKPLTAEQPTGYELILQKFPQHVKTYDGYIGVLIGLSYGEFPIYRLPSGEWVADRYEIETNSNARSDPEWKRRRHEHWLYCISSFQ